MSMEGDVPPAGPPAPSRPPGSAGFAALVAIGIFASRVTGLVRERAIAHFFGNSVAADALKAALRIPNLLQNLFGEGVLSASFIPVYARLLAQGERREAERVAGAVATTLTLLMSALVLLGELGASWLVDAIAPGFQDDRRELTVTLVRVIFPGVALLVLCAWCLGILNSHRRFLLSYSVSVIGNAAVIAALIWRGPGREQAALAIDVAWATLAGSAAQLAVQLPRTLQAVGSLRLGLGLRDGEVRTVFTNFLPAFVSRGVVQISGYVDQILASLLPLGAVAALGYAQTLYMLPVSLFGMSISAAELPFMSSALGSASEIAAQLRARLEAAMRRVAFFIVPSAVAFVALGNVITAAIYQTGEFRERDVLYVWAIIAASAVGLLAATLARLYASTYYALRDTRTPMLFACLRLATAVALGIVLAFRAPGWIGIDPKWGAAGLGLAGSLAGWLELALLRRTLARRIGRARLTYALGAKLWGVALASAALAGALEAALATWLPGAPLLVSAGVVLGLFGALYLGATLALGIGEARAVLGFVLAWLRGGRR